MTDYVKRREERWESGAAHQPEAIKIAKALAKYLPEYYIRFGGDGDAGEDMQLALSLWIEDGKPDD